MSRPARGELYARKGTAWYSASKAPAGARWWFRISIYGNRRSLSLNTTDKNEAIRRRDAWLAGLRLDSYEGFLQSIIEAGRKAERELAASLSGKGVAPPPRHPRRKAPRR